MGRKTGLHGPEREVADALVNSAGHGLAPSGRAQKREVFRIRHKSAFDESGRHPGFAQNDEPRAPHASVRKPCGGCEATLNAEGELDVADVV